MSHYEGYDAEQEGHLDMFLERVKQVLETGGSKAKGAEKRYALTIGLENRIVILEPTVTTAKGVITLSAWNISTEDINKIKELANRIGLIITLCPYLWFEMPATLPGYLPVESIPSSWNKEKKTAQKPLV